MRAEFALFSSKGQSMSYRVGDTVFLSQGLPAVTTGRNEHKGTVLLDRDQDAVRKNARHGYINGIAPERREEFLGILDEVKKHAEPAQRVEALQKQIDLLLEDPKNHQFVNYLESEKNHIINTSGYKPRMYHAEEFKLR